VLEKEYFTIISLFIIKIRIALLLKINVSVLRLIKQCVLLMQTIELRFQTNFQTLFLQMFMVQRRKK
jgi:hypothetical protein